MEYWSIGVPRETKIELTTAGLGCSKCGRIRSNTPTLQHSNTPTLRVAGFEDEDDDENEPPGE
jgi:hypothetical protein